MAVEGTRGGPKGTEGPKVEKIAWLDRLSGQERVSLGLAGTVTLSFAIAFAVGKCTDTGTDAGSVKGNTVPASAHSALSKLDGGREGQSDEEINRVKEEIMERLYAGENINNLQKEYEKTNPEAWKRVKLANDYDYFSGYFNLNQVETVKSKLSNTSCLLRNTLAYRKTLSDRGREHFQGLLLQYISEISDTDPYLISSYFNLHPELQVAILYKIKPSDLMDEYFKKRLLNSAQDPNAIEHEIAIILDPPKNTQPTAGHSTWIGGQSNQGTAPIHRVTITP